MVASLCKHYAVMKILPQLKQLEQGLSFFKVLQLLRANCSQMKPLLTSSSFPQTITSDKILDLLEPQLALEGNHLREVQEGVVLNWSNYIQAIQGILFTNSFLFMATLTFHEYFSRGEWKAGTE